MNKTKFPYTNDYLYNSSLDNGLDIYMVPNKKVNKIYATFCTKYGSSVTEFIPINKKEMIKVPKGIAHFLEHKVFEQKDGENSLRLFSKNGVNCNAFTGDKMTTYLFSGTLNFETNINLLLDFVQSPYFTDENVKKEKGIIFEEIKMYDDMPDALVYYGIKKNMFHINGYKYRVSGKIEDVEKITKENLYDCYNTFYNPSNMFLVITGNIDPEETLKIIKDNQSKKSFDKIDEIVVKKYNEPESVAKKYEEKIINVEIPKVIIGIKIKKDSLDVDDLILNEYIYLLFKSNFGVLSTLSEELINKELLSSPIRTSAYDADGFVIVLLSFEALKYKEVIEEARKKLETMEVSAEDLEIHKKISKSDYIHMTDDIEGINEHIMEEVIDFNVPNINFIKKVENMDMSTLNKVKRNINYKNITIFVGKDNIS